MYRGLAVGTGTWGIAAVIPKYLSLRLDLQVPDESLVSKVKNACKMLVGVTSVKVLSKREKSDACIESSEREATRRNVKVQKSTPKVDDITKTAHYKEAMDDVKNGRVYHANSVDDMFKQILG